jgi:hypothetical protein
LFVDANEFAAMCHEGWVEALKDLGLGLDEVGYSGLAGGDVLAVGESHWFVHVGTESDKGDSFFV